jgi:hypothetical protein
MSAVQTTRKKTDMEKTPEELVLEQRSGLPPFKSGDNVPPKLLLPWLDKCCVFLQKDRKFKSNAPVGNIGFRDPDAVDPTKSKPFFYTLNSVRTGSGFEGFSEETLLATQRSGKIDALISELSTLGAVAFHAKYKEGLRGPRDDPWVSVNFEGFYEDPETHEKTDDSGKAMICSAAIKSAVFSKPGMMRTSIIFPKPDPDVYGDQPSEDERALAMFDAKLKADIIADAGKVQRYVKRTKDDKDRDVNVRAGEMRPEYFYAYDGINVKDTKSLRPIEDINDPKAGYHGLVRLGAQLNGAVAESEQYKVAKLSAVAMKTATNVPTDFYCLIPSPQWNAEMAKLKAQGISEEMGTKFLAKKQWTRDAKTKIPLTEVDKKFAKYTWNKYGKDVFSMKLDRVDVQVSSISWTDKGGYNIKQKAVSMVAANAETPGDEVIQKFYASQLVKPCKYLGYVERAQVGQSFDPAEALAFAINEAENAKNTQVTHEQRSANPGPQKESQFDLTSNVVGQVVDPKQFQENDGNMPTDESLGDD